jgi:putative membrane protein
LNTDGNQQTIYRKYNSIVGQTYMFMVIPKEISRKEKASCSVNNRTMFTHKKEGIYMFWGFHGMWLLLPLLLFSKLFWILILALLIWALLRRLRGGPMPFYRHEPSSHPGVPPVQPSAMEILRQRYARGEIDAVTFEQMRERLESSSGPSQQ